MVDVAAFIQGRKRPTVTITLYSDASKWERVEELRKRLALAKAESVGLRSDAPAIQQELDAAEADLESVAVRFVFQAVGRTVYEQLIESCQDGKAEDELFNPATFPPALLAAAAVDPSMTLEEATAFWSALTQGEAEHVFTKVFQLQWDRPSPGYGGGIGTTRFTGQSSSTATSMESPTPGS